MVTALIAAAAFIAVILGLITAILGLENQRRAAKALKLAMETAGKVQTISVNVDGRMSAMIERQSQLLDAMHAAEVPIPPRTSETQERKI